MIVYRYLTAQYALAALQTKKWKVGRLLELNDPLDCQPTLVGAPAHANDDAQQAFEHRYFATVSEEIGIICYSAVINDPVVWSHYAEAHRGIALGFDYPDPGELFEVHYINQRATIQYDAPELREGPASEEGLLKLVRHGFTKKATSWGYEKEYRQFIRLDGCSLEGTHYFRPIPEEHLRHIILGVRCAMTIADMRRLIKGLTRAKPGLIQITKARIGRDTYKLDVPSAAQEG